MDNLLGNQNTKRTGPTRKHPTWNADGASVSKTSWGAPGCGMAVNTNRCSGRFDFTCKFSVDIALKTLLFLACVNFFKTRFHRWSAVHPFDRLAVLKFYHLRYVCRAPSKGPAQISSSCGILTVCYLCSIFYEAAHQQFKGNLTKTGV